MNRNKRIRKKIARIENDWYKGKDIKDYDCPYCGTIFEYWDSNM